ncbi:MFS transporter [Microbacterium gorillae]|uniref:MFS transporter n=1 Tax=Microbacterium gorillae TaxID=1231063 RepID=UPI00058AE60F|nr:MFS transporter [Microbacterium gorillae]
MTTPDAADRDPQVRATVDTDALPALALDENADRVIPRKQVWSWAMWDWATQPFNSVILTFVFTTLYLISDTFLDPSVAALADDNPVKQAAFADLAATLGWGTTIAGILIALLAPVLAQRADAAGKRKQWLIVYTTALVVTMALLYFVQGAPEWFILGVVLISAGTVFSELAGVNYNSMITQVATPKTVGRVSGLGWGLGYIGGIVALVIVVLLNSFHWFGMDTSNGMAYRLIAVGCAVWAVVFSIPLVLNVAETPKLVTGPKRNFFLSYVDLFRHIARIFREDRPTFWFLCASAVYRDGLSGVFTFGAVIAARVFGFSSNEVIIFGIAANLIAGIGTIIGGRLDDRFGPRAVIIGALSLLVLSGFVVFVAHDSGKVVFWICGMVLSSLVGPVQSASRSLLARVTPVGREGEIFGLYATTGRAASWLASLAWTLLIAWFGAIYWGILGIIAVIAVGLVLMLFVKMPHVTGEDAAKS